MNPQARALAAALPQRARLALEIARSYDSECDAATAFCLASQHPHWGVERLQKAIRSQTRRDRGQRVFTPPWATPASGLPLTADLGRSAGLPEPHHLEDPAALAELFEFVEALASDPAARARLALEDEQDELARHQTALTAKALGLTRRRAQQMRRAALQAERPRRAWQELVWQSASHSTAKALRRKAASGRKRLCIPGQLSLLEG
ncbi:hypothetical protein GALL_244920 [mine drainage metagenome]|uniref:Uncharacterized protein n=1 Tax=mine drainage metagenome TaxID=410659 RepID=A0A1J5RN75_9ZZZZ